MPVIRPIADIFFSLIQILSSVLNALEPLFELLGVFTGEVLAKLADLLQIVADGFTWVSDLVNGLFEQFNKFDGGPITEFFNTIYNYLSQTVPFLKVFGDIWANTVAKMQAPDTSQINKNQRELYQAYLKSGLIAGQPKATPTPPGPGADKETKDSVKQFFDNLADEMKQNIARIKLQRLGASEGLIDSIVGTGEDWEKVYNRILKSGVKGVKAIQAQFRQTASGIKETVAAYDVLIDAAKEAADAQTKLVEQAIQDAEDAQQAWDDQVAAFNDFKDSIDGIVASIKPLAIVTREVGAFEQSVIDSFQNIADAIQQGIKDKILTEGASALIEYANKEKAVLVELGRQRDVIANKRSLAEALFKDVKSAIVGIANINDRVVGQSEKVTETVTRMVGNLTISTSRTIETIAQSETIATTLSKTLEKTKKFAQQLKELRKLGLDQNLFKQIVDAGVDAGSVTAAEIIAGGADTVGELNTLFADLNTVGADIAKETADVMYNAGINITTGLADGLIAEENAIIKAAETLANSFINTFNSMMANFKVVTPAPAQTTIPILSNDPDIQAYVERATEGMTGTALANQLKMLSGMDVSQPGSFMNTVGYMSGTKNVEVKVYAGLGTNGKVVGQTIQSYLNQYEKANV